MIFGLILYKIYSFHTDWTIQNPSLHKKEIYVFGLIHILSATTSCSGLTNPQFNFSCFSHISRKTQSWQRLIQIYLILWRGRDRYFCVRTIWTTVERRLIPIGRFSVDKVGDFFSISSWVSWVCWLQVCQLSNGHKFITYKFKFKQVDLVIARRHPANVAVVVVMNTQRNHSAIIWMIIVQDSVQSVIISVNQLNISSSIRVNTPKNDKWAIMALRFICHL